MLLGPGLFFYFQLHQYLAKKLDSILQKIGVFVQSNLDKVLAKCYSWISHLVSPFWLANLMEAQDDFFCYFFHHTMSHHLIAS